MRFEIILSVGSEQKVNKKIVDENQEKIHHADGAKSGKFWLKQNPRKLFQRTLHTTTVKNLP
jgi:hypothetical protein